MLGKRLHPQSVAGVRPYHQQWGAPEHVRLPGLRGCRTGERSKPGQSRSWWHWSESGWSYWWGSEGNLLLERNKRGGEEEKERVENCEADTTLFHQYMHTITQTCTHNGYTGSHFAVILQTSKQRQKPQQHGPKPITRSLRSKPSSLWEVDTRHGSVAQKYSLPTKGFNIHAGMCGGKKERGCSSNLPSFLHLPLPPLPRKWELSPYLVCSPVQCRKCQNWPHTHAYVHIHTEKYHSDLECSHAGFV